MIVPGSPGSIGHDGGFDPSPQAGRHPAGTHPGCCGYEDANDLDTLRDDPGFRVALGKLPGSGAGLASQPTTSRRENAPTTHAVVTLDIHDTSDVVHGYQQLSPQGQA